MRIINIKKWEIEIWNKKRLINTYKMTYFSFMWNSIKIWTPKWDIVIGLDWDYIIYLKWKIRYKNFRN